MKQLPDLLVPRPQAVDLAGDQLALPARIRIAQPPGAAAAGARLAAKLERLGFETRTVGADEPAEIRLRLDDEAPHAESYRLDVGSGGIAIAAGSPAGLFYGTVTLAQWAELHRGEDGGKPPWLTGVAIRDRPDFPVRGVMLDVSRDKVPRLATLFALADLFAGLKVNQLQLYTEHTFAYRGHETVWRHASPLTAEDVRRLDAYCAERFIELVPNQQSFGHFHRWLVHPPYRHLAECPEGFEHPFSLVPEPFGLCPLDPGSPELLADLYDQLLPSFRSRLFNVGLDEALDLGHGRSRQACAERGRHRVYLDFLKEVHALVTERGRRMQFWGDVILERPFDGREGGLQRPQLVAELPEDAVTLQWGYEADHPFAADSRRFAAAGRDFYVCPGTSSWNSFAGRTRNALLNLASAAVHGHANGAAGYLITDWGDFGHLQPLPSSFPGYLAGAAFAWNVTTARAPLDLPVAEALDRHVFRDRAGVAGAITTGLGDAYLHAGALPRNGSALFFLVVFALLERERVRIKGVTAEALEKTLDFIESTAAPLAAMRPEIGGGELVERELAWTAEMLAFACRLGRARLEGGEASSFAAIPRARREALAGELRTLIERHREIFLARNRPGGLEASSGWLWRVAELL